MVVMIINNNRNNNNRNRNRNSNNDNKINNNKPIMDLDARRNRNTFESLLPSFLLSLSPLIFPGEEGGETNAFQNSSGKTVAQAKPRRSGKKKKLFMTFYSQFGGGATAPYCCYECQHMRRRVEICSVWSNLYVRKDLNLRNV